MSEDDENPVTSDPAVMADLARRFESDLDSKTLVDYARSIGVTPPDDRDGWEIVKVYGPDGGDRGLHWDNSDDDDQAWLDY